VILFAADIDYLLEHVNKYIAAPLAGFAVTVNAQAMPRHTPGRRSRRLTC